jgi:hypothetical protein
MPVPLVDGCAFDLGAIIRRGMRLLFACAISILTVSGLAMAKTWNTATSKNEATGRVIIFRFIEELDRGFERSSQPVCVIIVWKYQGNNGMPVASERQRMDAMEDLLQPVIEADGFSSLALVSTGEDLREWIYYAKSEPEFFERLNRALEGQPAFPIEIHASSDPAWTNYQEFIDGLRK